MSSQRPAGGAAAHGATIVPRDFVLVAGPDAVSYVQGQASQDVEGLAVGDSAYTFLLQPQGKVDVWGRISRVADDQLLFDVDAGYGAAAVARLERFKLRVKATVAPVGWRCVALRGRGWDRSQLPPAVVVAPVDWPPMVGLDLLGPDVTLPEGAVPLDPVELERLRIEAGIPAMGSELDERTIPAEAGVVDRSVSFTKGCYTGQELTARIDSRGGNVPRHLRGLVLVGDGAEVPPAGAEIVVAGNVVGTVTSAAPGTAGGVVALGYVKRGVEPPAAATVRWDGGELGGEVRALPLLPLPA